MTSPANRKKPRFRRFPLSSQRTGRRRIHRSKSGDQSDGFLLGSAVSPPPGGHDRGSFMRYSTIRSPTPRCSIIETGAIRHGFVVGNNGFTGISTHYLIRGEIISNPAHRIFSAGYSSFRLLQAWRAATMFAISRSPAGLHHTILPSMDRIWARDSQGCAGGAS